MSECKNARDHSVCKENAEAKFPIQKVKNNTEKAVTYQVYMQRFNQAKAFGFYLECLWILYAMMEDRASAFLYHIGFTSAKKRTSVTGVKKIKADIREILEMEPNKNDYRLNNLSGKIDRIKKLLAWCKEEHETLSEYQKALVKAILPVADSDALHATLNYLETEWREKRNQLTHALFIKNPEAVLDALRPLIEQGYNAVRQMDIAVKQAKKKKIRLKFNIQ